MRAKCYTKGMLLRRCSKELFKGWLLIWGAAFVYFVITGLVQHTPWYTLLMVTGIWTVLSWFIFLVVCSLGTIKGLLLLRRQEKLLGFRFSDEEIPVGGSHDRWFISCDFYLLAFRRDYIRKAGKIHLLYRNGLSRMAILDCQGKQHWIRDHRDILKELKAWLARETTG